MASRNNDPEIKRLALRLRQGGLSYMAIGRMLGIAHTTVKWYVERDIARPPDIAPRDELPTCFVCAGRSPTWDGHDRCRGRRSA